MERIQIASALAEKEIQILSDPESSLYPIIRKKLQELFPVNKTIQTQLEQEYPISKTTNNKQSSDISEEYKAKQNKVFREFDKKAILEARKIQSDVGLSSKRRMNSVIPESRRKSIGAVVKGEKINESSTRASILDNSKVLKGNVTEIIGRKSSIISAESDQKVKERLIKNLGKVAGEFGSKPEESEYKSLNKELGWSIGSKHFDGKKEISKNSPSAVKETISVKSYESNRILQELTPSPIYKQRPLLNSNKIVHRNGSITPTIKTNVKTRNVKGSGNSPNNNENFFIPNLNSGRSHTRSGLAIKDKMTDLEKMRLESDQRLRNAVKKSIIQQVNTF
jgi:hypothetical protein